MMKEVGRVSGIDSSLSSEGNGVFLRRIFMGVLCAGFILSSPVLAADAAAFYTQKGNDPSFEQVMASGQLPRGKNSGNGFEGSTIEVNHALLKDGPNGGRPMIQDIMIHTLGHSVISRKDFPRWSRWYQEDGNTQVFRLFKGEENVRNSRKLAARIEAHSQFGWKKGDGWQEWVATYTIIKPHSCAIFQAKNPINHWSFMLNMNDEGDVFLNHRRAENQILARDMVGKPFHVRLRENGHDYEVYFNGEKVGEGFYSRPKGKTSFRWGMYLGAKEVRHDAMILVTGAAINPKEPSLPAFDGIRIPLRVWTNANGQELEVEARYEPGSEGIDFLVDHQWSSYPLSRLSIPDQVQLAGIVAEKSGRPAEVRVRIPLQVWTNAEGQELEAEARYEPGSETIEFLAAGRWNVYSLTELSIADQKKLADLFEGMEE